MNYVNENGNLSTHFKLREFKCKCGQCTHTTVDDNLLQLLENIRSHFGKPVVINSGYRCPSWNTAVGGSSKSQHMLGKAADIRIKGVAPKAIYDYCRTIMPHGGLGLYPTFVHVDVRDGNLTTWRK